MGIQALIDTQVLSVTGSTGDVMTLQADGSYLAATPAGGGVGGSTGAVDNAVLRADGTGGVTLQTSAFTIADLATASPNNTVNNVSMAPTGGTTNVSVSIVPKGTGSFSLAVPDGTATGGNARGANAVDLQTARTTAAQVASGSYSFVAGNGNTASGAYGAAVGLGNTSGAGSFTAGYINTVEGNWNAAIGYSCTVTGGNNGGCFATGKANSISVGNNSTAFVAGYLSSVTAGAGFAHGKYATAIRPNQYTHGGDFNFLAAGGGAQFVRLLAGIKTTDATPTKLSLDTTTTLYAAVTSGNIMFLDIKIVGILSTGASACCYKRKVAIKNVGGTTALVGTVETIGTDIEDNAACDVAITADDTDDTLQISVTGIAAETWRWMAVIEGVEMKYGT